MGMHIIVYKSEGEFSREPSWDTLRQWNDNEILSITGDIEYQCKPTADDYPPFRPKNLSIFKKNIENTDWRKKSKDRYRHLASLIERGCWMYISY